MATNKNGAAVTKTDTELDKLYKNYDILVNAKDKIAEHKDVYKAILAATKGSSGAKRLAATFVSKFGPKFPDLNDASLDSMFDLLEDEDSQVRRTVVKVIPEMCADSSQLSTRISDVLSQLLLAEDPTELAMVKSSLIILIKKQPKEALAGVFGQVMGDDDMTREKCIEFVCNSVMKIKNELFAKNFDTEQFFIEQIKQVLQDVTAEEFQQFVEVLLQLRTMATRKGAQELVDIVANQADLTSDFQDTDADYMYRLVTCYRLAVNIALERGASLSPFITFVCHKVFPILPVMEAKESVDDILQLFAQSFLSTITADLAKDIIQLLFDMLLHYTPEPPVDADNSEAPTLQFTYVECLLFSFHETVKLCPEFLAGDDASDKLKDFRKRLLSDSQCSVCKISFEALSDTLSEWDKPLAKIHLDISFLYNFKNALTNVSLENVRYLLQYFAHGCQVYHSQLEVTLKKNINEDARNIQKVGHATTGNINSLIKDFFHNPPSYKTKVKLSFLKEQPKLLLASKRPAPNNTTMTSPPPKRKVSPIRFGSSTPTTTGNTRKSAGGTVTKRQSRSVYEPPKGSYSDKLDTSSIADSPWKGGWGRGRGNRRGRGSSWRTGGKRAY